MPYGTIVADSITTSDGYTLGGTGATMKNRLINGAMTIDQRNNGSAVTGVSSGVYPVDRWQVYSTTTGLSASTQRDTTAPTGFVNSLKFTTTTGAASGSTERAQIQQVIEGLNVADLGWGTSGAKAITLSFWVRSSKTGQFGGSVQNYSSNRSYPFSYTINAANTWEKETITIPGDTTGTWVTDNSGGPCVNFNLGAGSSLLGSAGAWAATNYRGATGDTSIVETTNATFFVTGVQLEAGSTATSYDYRHYGTEFQLCQRYFQTCVNNTGIANSTTGFRVPIPLQTPMRATPTLSSAGVLEISYPGVAQFTQSSVGISIDTGSANGVLAQLDNFSGLTAQRVYFFLRANANHPILLSAEI
jgi:hypothetical protein